MLYYRAGEKDEILKINNECITDSSVHIHEFIGYLLK